MTDPSKESGDARLQNTETKVRKERSRRAVIAIMLLTGVARAYLCFQTPRETTDCRRSAAYGEAFWQHGFRVYDMVPGELHGKHFQCGVWGDHTFDYPATTLLFFAAATLVTNSLSVIKLILTAFDLGSALIVGRIVGAPWIAAACFAAPLGMWWTSMEGQSEALIAWLCLLSVSALLRNRQTAAFAWIGAAIQTKGLPALLLPPLFVQGGRRLRNHVILAITFIPSVIAIANGSYVSRMFQTGYKPSGINSVYWIPSVYRGWMSDRLLASEAVYSYGLLLIVSVGAGYAVIKALRGEARWSSLVSYVPLLLLLVWLKSGDWIQFWYFVLIPAFASVIDQRRTRTALIALSLLEPRACSQLWELLTS
jgi:hypothetical protein